MQLKETDLANHWGHSLARRKVPLLDYHWDFLKETMMGYRSERSWVIHSVLAMANLTESDWAQMMEQLKAERTEHLTWMARHLETLKEARKDEGLLAWRNL